MIPIDVLVADDHDLLRQAIGNLFGAEPDLRLVGVARNGLEAVELAELTRPDVVLMDVAMPVLDGVAATGRIVRNQPHVRVLMLTAAMNPTTLRSAAAAGASGYLLKTGDHAVLAAGVRACASGDRSLCPQVAWYGQPHVG